MFQLFYFSCRFVALVVLSFRAGPLGQSPFAVCDDIERANLAIMQIGFTNRSQKHPHQFLHQFHYQVIRSVYLCSVRINRWFKLISNSTQIIK